MSTRGPRHSDAEKRRFIRSVRNDRKFTKKVEKEWRDRLASSGFQDLEGADRDGPLSDRGNLHSSGEENAVPLPEKMEHGEAYIDWARDILQRLNGHSAHLRRRREIWERHANGDSLKEIGRTMPGVNFHIARDTVMAIQEKYQWSNETHAAKEPRDELAARRRMVKPIPTSTLTALAVSLLAGLRK